MNLLIFGVATVNTCRYWDTGVLSFTCDLQEVHICAGALIYGLWPGRVKFHWGVKMAQGSPSA